MGQNTSQIEREIAAERDELGRNLNELEARARRLTDWRGYYRRHPGPVLGAALVGGLVLGAVTGGRKRPASQAVLRLADGHAPRVKGRTSQLIEREMHCVSDALLGVASAKVMELIGRAVPGFNDHLKKSGI